MLIAIDASRAVNEKAGIGRYTRELIEKLIEIDQENQYLLLFTFGRGDKQKEKAIREFRRPNTQIKTWRLPGNFKEKVWGWQMPWLKYLLQSDGARSDIFYAPSFFEVNLGLALPQVVTIYDLTTFIFPEHRGKEVSQRLNERTLKACCLAKKIIAISQSTKKDLVKFKIPEAKIEVIYPGKTEFARIAPRLPQGLKSHSYILAVGTIEPRKNLIGLFKAYALLPLALQEKYPLVVAGAEGWKTGEIFASFGRLRLEGKIKFLGFVSDALLAKLYREAALFVYPSLYEGFGFPVLEAMSFGTPVITSNVSSLPEVAGEAAVLVDPQDPLALSSAIQRLLEHSGEAEDLRKKAKAQAEKFSWEKNAKEILKVFEEVANV